MSTSQVVEFIHQTSFDALPPDVVDQLKLAIRDHLGVMFAARDDRAVVAARKMVDAIGGNPEVSLLGTTLKAPVNYAAMVGAIMARTLDMDDGAYRPTGHLAHAGGVVVPAVMAAAELVHADGKALIEAAAVAYEVTLRAGWLISLRKMFVPAGMAGTYGAAAGAARLLGLDAVKTRHALGIAEAHCLYPSRAKKFTTMTMTKEAAGWGAMTGITAALLAQAGFEGPDTIFDLKEFNREPLATLGTEWEVMRLYFKTHSSCRFTHAPLEGLIEIMQQHKLSAADVNKVTVGVAFHAATMVNYRPDNIWQAQFSIPFVIGAYLTYGEVTPAQVNAEHLADAGILAQAQKVTLVGDAEVDALRPGMVPARVKVTTSDGRELETYVAHPAGGPEKPHSDAVLEAKFVALTGPALGADRSAALKQALDNLADLTDTAALAALFTPPQD
jgi:2-methylcitrate dehydratase PrpD